MFRFSAFLLVLCLTANAPVAAQPAQLKGDARKLLDCVSKKAGPEGDMPPDGALRAQFLKEMEGGPQACIGFVEEPCAKAGGDSLKCIGREARAWRETLINDRTGIASKNQALWRAAASRTSGYAIALCEAAAAVSAWGSRKVTDKGKYGFTLESKCVRDGIAQQAILLLVNARGN